MSEFWSVPPIWRGQTAFLVAGGPSLEGFDGSCLAGRNVITINDSYKLVPDAPFTYFCDAKWFDWHYQNPEFRNHPGQKVKLTPAITGEKAEGYDIKILCDYTAVRKRTSPGNDDLTGGLELEPDGVRTGRNSGYQCINLAYHLGATTIVLLGYDMKSRPDGKVHWFGNHPRPTKPDIFKGTMLKHFPTLIEPLAAAGVRVINCTPQSAIDCFPKQELRDLL